MDFKIVAIFIFFECFLACASKTQKENSGIVQLKSVFYASDGMPSFTDLKKLWYKDSLTIEQVNLTSFVTDTANVTTVNYSVLLFRFIDLRNRRLYDYRSFSDTALAFNTTTLPDSMMKDHGWSYYSNKVRQIQGTPDNLNDTIINNVNYKRVKFNFLGDNLQKGYKIGYYRCDEKGRLFSLEKTYSKKLNCAMIRFDDFQFNQPSPFASLEIEFLSDTLTVKELKVFEAWERNAKKSTVKK